MPSNDALKKLVEQWRTEAMTAEAEASQFSRATTPSSDAAALRRRERAAIYKLCAVQLAALIERDEEGGAA